MGVFNKIPMSVFLRGAAALCLLGAVFALKPAVAAVPPHGALIVNTVTADYTDASGAAMPQESGTATVTSLWPGVLSVAITASPDPVYAGDNITYTITVTNVGPSPLTGVSLADTIPANTTFVSADYGGILSSGVITWDIGGLGVGESVTVHMVVEVDQSAPGGLVIDDTVTASSNEAADDSASVQVTVIARTQGEVIFTDASGNPVDAYTAGGMIYVMVMDADQNNDPATQQTVTVVIVSNTGGPGAAVLDTITITLTETGPDTGIFFGSVQSTLAPADPADGLLTVETDSMIVVTYTDPLDPMPSTDDTAFIDPLGVVFDSFNGAPVEGAVVTLIDEFTGLAAVLPQPPAVPVAQPNPVTTLADGAFQFQYVNPGTYHLEVAPGALHAFPSTVPDANMPPGYTVITGSRGESFTLAGGMGALNLDVPVDPYVGVLNIMKAADRKAVQIGDIITYTIKITNEGISPVNGVELVDVMPHGVVYVKGSTRINGRRGPDPVARGGRELAWSLGALQPGESIELTYSAVAGPDSVNGSGVNTAFASGISAGMPVASGKAVFKVDISEGVFTSKGTVIGKAYDDANSDGRQQEGEPGVAGIVLYMEDGTRVITDRDGKYTIHGVTPGTHAVKVDRTSLPAGAGLEAATNRFMGDCGSQFVDMNESGLVTADFPMTLKRELPAEGSPSAAGAAISENVPPSGTAVPAVSGGKVQQAPESAVAGTKPDAAGPGLQAPSGDAAPADPYEELIREMNQDLEILEPSGPAVMAGDSIDVVVKAHSEADVSLSVNGAEVDRKQVGKKIVLEKGKVAIYRYVAVKLEPGMSNIVRAEARDPFGNVRGAKEFTAVSPGRPARIVMTPDGAEAPADGVTETEFRVEVFDASGNAVPAPGTMTATATAGEIIGEDADSSSSGTQIMPEMGVFRVILRSPREPGQARVTVLCNGVEQSAEVYFSPYLRPIMAIGVGEAVLGYGSASGKTGVLTMDGKFDEDLYAWGRGAFFVKGGVGGGMLLTASYDSDKKKRDEEFFREKRNDVESEELYPIYGDESKQGYEARSSKKLYLRLDRGRSYLMYGDYETDLSQTRLAAFRRTLSGIKTELSEGPFRLKGFASETGNVQVVDRFQGRGIAGYYFLSRSPVVDGSELVVIETRDRLQPDRVLKRETMGRWSDYRIEYPAGALLFKEPIESRDEELNPVYIIVSYESEGGDRNYVYGGRASAEFLGRVTTGLTGVVEQNGVRDNMLLGADLAVKLPLDTVFTAEWARSRSLFSANSILSSRTGDAWYARLAGKPVDGLGFDAMYYDYGGSFANPSAVDVLRGRKGYSLDVSYALGDKTRLAGRFLKDDDTLNGMDHLYASAGVATELGGVKAGVEVLHERSKDSFVPKTSPDTRFPFDISEDTPTELTALKARLEARVYKDFFATLEHMQGLSHNRLNATTAGLEYRYSELTRFYVREQYAMYDDGDRTRTVAGVESTVAKDTVAYSEYRLTGGADGMRNQHGIGLRNKFTLAEGVTGNVAVENLRTLSGAEKQNEEDAFAASVGLEYLPQKDLKASTRLEYRDSTSQVSRLAELGLSYKLNTDLSAMLTGRYFDDRAIDLGRRSSVLARFGLAYRPAWTDRFNALAKAEYRHGLVQGGSTAGANPDSYMVAVEAAYRAARGLDISGKYAGKYSSLGSVSSYTDLVSARVTYDITDSFDLALTGRMLTGHLIDTRTFGGAAELGYRLMKNVWLSAGYSFDSFDSDLTGDDYRGGGPFVRLRVKLDEGLLSGGDCGRPASE